MNKNTNDRAKKSKNMTISPDSDANQHDHADELVKQLRERSCPAGEPWTGDYPEEDHGHTDCWLHHQAAKEIEQLRALITAWVDADGAPSPVYNAARRALRSAIGR
jgi:hypothetical protein